MTGDIILFILAVVACLILYPIYFYTVVDEKDRNSFLWGWFMGICFLFMTFVGTVSAISIWEDNDKYLDKYSNKLDKVESYQVDTTFITTGCKTDTIYTLYYDKIEE